MYFGVCYSKIHKFKISCTGWFRKVLWHGKLYSISIVHDLHFQGLSLFRDSSHLCRCGHYFCFVLGFFAFLSTWHFVSSFSMVLCLALTWNETGICTSDHVFIWLHVFERNVRVNTSHLTWCCADNALALVMVTYLVIWEFFASIHLFVKIKWMLENKQSWHRCCFSTHHTTPHDRR